MSNQSMNPFHILMKLSILNIIADYVVVFGGEHLNMSD